MEKTYSINLKLKNALLEIKPANYKFTRDGIWNEEKYILGEYDLKDCIDEIIRNKPEIVAFDCARGTLRYAGRIINTIDQEIKELSYIVYTDELAPGIKYRIAGVEFTAFWPNTHDEISIEESEWMEVRNITFSDLPAIHDGIYKTVMENGYILFRTGLYPNNTNKKQLSKHVSIPKRDAAETVRKLDMETNSAVFIRGQGFDRKLFEELMSVPGCLSHFHFLDEEGNAQFDDSGFKTDFIFTSFSDYYTQGFNSAVSEKKYMLRLETREDYLAYENVLNEFAYSGIIRNPMFYIENECKLMRICIPRGEYRYTLDDSLNVCPCNFADINIGSLDDNPIRRNALFSSIKNSRKEGFFCNNEKYKPQRSCKSACNEIERHRHGCIGCSRCELTDAEESRLICDIYTGKWVAREFLIKKNLFMFLCSQSQLIKNAKRILIPNREFSVLYTGPEVICTGHESHCLFVIDGKYYIFDTAKPALITLDPKMFLIVEGMIKQAGNSSIIRALSVYCDVNLEKAEELYEKGLNELCDIGIGVDRYLDWLEFGKAPK